jgi:hypothetical protein
MLAGENIASAAHIRGELVHLVEPPIRNLATEILIAEIANCEIIGFGFSKGRKFQVDAADPKTFAL